MITESRRDERAKAIVAEGNQIKKVTDHSFKVKSQSGKGVYEVKETKDEMTCRCPDFVYRGGNCKHIAATRYYLEVQKETPQGIVYEKIHLTYAQAWDAYNAAQKSEIKLFDELLRTWYRPYLNLSNRLWEDHAYQFMKICSALYRKCTLNSQVVALTAYSRTRLRKAKSVIL